MIASTGSLGARAIWGKTADWCAIHARHGERTVGFASFADPRNARRSWWHVRDYGLLVANAFGARSGADAASTITVRRGEQLRLRYTLQVFEADALPAFADVYRRIVSEGEVDRADTRLRNP